MKLLIGPFKQIITMNGLPANGPVSDESLEIIPDGGIVIENDTIIRTGNFESLRKEQVSGVEEISDDCVLVPGFIDAHSHACFAGSRAGEYAERIRGSSYQEILKKGGGIHDTVNHTRQASFEELSDLTELRIGKHFRQGVTTMEIKSGYGLNVQDELKMLDVIFRLNQKMPSDLVATCLAAHVLPREWNSSDGYLRHLVKALLPLVWEKKLSRRVDIFIEKGAFEPEESYSYLSGAKKMGFGITIHADQFTPGGSDIAARVRALSADHLEMTNERQIRLLTEHGVVQTVLPGASLGLGQPFAPARKILDSGGCLAIASDWNPGSAPMGDLLTEASLLSAFEKLSFAETMAGITFRAAKALSLKDRGILKVAGKADFIGFPTDDYREILYHQGQLKPGVIWKSGIKYVNHRDHEKTAG